MAQRGGRGRLGVLVKPGLMAGMRPSKRCLCPLKLSSPAEQPDRRVHFFHFKNYFLLCVGDKQSNAKKEGTHERLSFVAPCSFSAGVAGRGGARSGIESPRSSS